MNIRRRTVIATGLASVATAGVVRANSPASASHDDMLAEFMTSRFPGFQVSVHPALWSSAPAEVLDILDSFAVIVIRLKERDGEFPYRVEQYDLDDGGMATVVIEPAPAPHSVTGVLRVKRISPGAANLIRHREERGKA